MDAPKDDLLEFTQGIEFNGQSSYLFRIHKICINRDAAFSDGLLDKYYRNTMSLFGQIAFKLKEKNITEAKELEAFLDKVVDKIILNERNNSTALVMLNHNRRIYEKELFKINTILTEFQNKCGLIFPSRQRMTTKESVQASYK